MAELTLPGNIEGVTDSWLTEALRSNGVIQNANVTTLMLRVVTGTGPGKWSFAKLKIGETCQ
jgi:hypothetical protein